MSGIIKMSLDVVSALVPAANILKAAFDYHDKVSIAKHRYEDLVERVKHLLQQLSDHIKSGECRPAQYRGNVERLERELQFILDMMKHQADLPVFKLWLRVGEISHHIENASQRLTDCFALFTALHREAKIWSGLRHAHIVQFYGVSTSSPYEPFIVSRYMKNGNLIQYIRQHEDVDRIQLIHEVALGMQFLHDKRIIHGDLKGVNVLIDDTKKACITDFGLSRFRRDVHVCQSGNTSKQIAGTLRWMAPESIKRGIISFHTDVYAFAMLIYETLTGDVPFMGRTDEEIESGDLSLQRPISTEILENGLTDDMWKHMSESTLLNHDGSDEGQKYKEKLSSPILSQALVMKITATRYCATLKLGRNNLPEVVAHDGTYPSYPIHKSLRSKEAASFHTTARHGVDDEIWSLHSATITRTSPSGQILYNFDRKDGAQRWFKIMRKIAEGKEPMASSQF
ncbi:hypothetical protein CERSUDRAFT_91390 [Gelatoporia subvermispora B]|uniref:Protein kinase domain-containing protein n=1 Tax=Ceriporiopsis subvermispora (strain B) TaxID=914234 RepID=M2RQC7_CERS8|nr:hypothetical protein CERSUDRAFT_91390 [Gelatoporia subvermispora B]